MPLYVATQDGIALSAATAKTVMELATTSTCRAKLVSWWVEFDGTSSTAVPGLVQIARATATVTGTAVTECKYDDYAPNPLTQAIHTATAEGTIGDILENHRIPPTSGIYVQYPLGREIQIPVSGFLRIRCTFAAAVNCTVGMVWEE